MREPISDELRRHVLERDNFTCVYCGAKPGRFHIDHVIPVVHGGMNTAGNLVTACARCNLQKAGKLLSWARRYVAKKEAEYADMEAAQAWAWLYEDGFIPDDLRENFEVQACH